MLSPVKQNGFGRWWALSLVLCLLAATPAAAFPCSPGQRTGTGPISMFSCFSCEAGTYHPTGTGSSCFDCAAGTYSGPGAASCVDCDAGTYSGPGATSCDICEPGTFSEFSASSSCINCPLGTYNNEEGASACEDCQCQEGMVCIPSTGECEIFGKRVVIEVEQGTALNLAEVACYDGSNVNIPRTAITLSSVLRHRFRANRCDDGDVSTFCSSDASAAEPGILTLYLSGGPDQVVAYCEVTNRIHACCKNRIDGASFKILDADDNALYSSFFVGAEDSYTFDIGKRVVIEVEQGTALNLAEVACYDGSNVKIPRTDITLSSVLRHRFRANRCDDGDVSTFCHSDASAAEPGILTLYLSGGPDQVVAYCEVTNRLHACCKDRIDGASFKILDADGTTELYANTFPSPARETYTFTLGLACSGGYDDSTGTCTCAPPSYSLVCTDTACQDKTFEVCMVECTDPDSCIGATFKDASTVTCSDEFSCLGATFKCQSTATCSGELSCMGATFECESTAACSGVESCRGTTFQGSSTAACSELDSCRDATFGGQSTADCSGVRSCLSATFEGQSTAACSGIGSCDEATFDGQSTAACSALISCDTSLFIDSSIATCATTEYSCRNLQTAAISPGTACCIGEFCSDFANLCPDEDGDGVADRVDNCPDTPNALQEDSDEDGIGDVCDT